MPALPDGGAQQGKPLKRHRALGALPQASDDFHQLALPVALHAGHAQNLTLAHVQRNPAQRLFAKVSRVLQIPHRQLHLAGGCLCLVDFEHHVAPHHHA